mmetsp:Transcript_7382/g.18111  ORF Transcript_7382/g.18111 Transcript_7382/m.18111 type:complete len:158 (+) Transcript_7382:381-854(+)
MVVKTELCHFSGFRIYPGRGRRYIRVDGKSFTFLNSKSESLFQQRRRPAVFSWTAIYRRLHKKGIQEDTTRRRARRSKAVVTKAVEGASLEVIKAKRAQKPEVRKAARDAALKEIKERNKAAKGKKAPAAGGKAEKGGAAQKAAKAAPKAAPAKQKR